VKQRVIDFLRTNSYNMAKNIDLQESILKVDFRDDIRLFVRGYDGNSKIGS